MPQKFDAIYQSGEKIPLSGTFEVVGVTVAHAAQRHERAIRELKAGEAFATYEGLEVCWHFVDGRKRQDIETPTSIM